MSIVRLVIIPQIKMNQSLAFNMKTQLLSRLFSRYNSDLKLQMDLREVDIFLDLNFMSFFGQSRVKRLLSVKVIAYGVFQSKQLDSYFNYKGDVY